MIPLLYFFAIIGCSSDEPAPYLAGAEAVEDGSALIQEPVAPPVVHLTVEPMRTAETLEDDAVAVDLALQFDGVGRSHRGYFRDPEILREVGLSLAGVMAPPANVHISASGARGEITAVITAEALQSPMMTDDGQVNIAALTPITMSMAGYRELVAGRFDFRVQSFGVSVSVVGESSWCTFTATGQHPPTGEQFAQCLDVDGDEVCGVITGGTFQLAAADAERVSACLR